MRACRNLYWFHPKIRLLLYRCFSRRKTDIEFALVKLLLAQAEPPVVHRHSPDAGSIARAGLKNTAPELAPVRYASCGPNAGHRNGYHDPDRNRLWLKRLNARCVADVASACSVYPVQFRPDVAGHHAVPPDNAGCGQSGSEIQGRIYAASLFQ